MKEILAHAGKYYSKGNREILASPLDMLKLGPTIELCALVPGLQQPQWAVECHQCRRFIRNAAIQNPVTLIEAHTRESQTCLPFQLSLPKDEDAHFVLTQPLFSAKPYLTIRVKYCPSFHYTQPAPAVEVKPPKEAPRGSLERPDNLVGLGWVGVVESAQWNYLQALIALPSQKMRDRYPVGSENYKIEDGLFRIHGFLSSYLVCANNRVNGASPEIRAALTR